MDNAVEKGEMPILYKYICRNMQRFSQNYLIFFIDGNEKKKYKIFKSIIHTAPSFIYRQILEEYIKFGCLTRMNRDVYRINYQKSKCKKCLAKLNEFAFILNSSYRTQNNKDKTK